MKEAIELPPKLAQTMPSTSSTTVGLDASFRQTVQNDGVSADASWASECPLAGSLRVNRASKANTSPGRPSTMKAMRQLKWSAIQPPTMAPSMIPNGTPAE